MYLAYLPIVYVVQGPSCRYCHKQHSAVATVVLRIQADVCGNPRHVFAAASCEDHAAAAVGACAVDLRSAQDTLVSASIHMQHRKIIEASNQARMEGLLFSLSILLLLAGGGGTSANGHLYLHIHISRQEDTHLFEEVKAGPRGQKPRVQAVQAVDVLDRDEEAVARDVLAGLDRLLPRVLARKLRLVADPPERLVQDRLGPDVLPLLALVVAACPQGGAREQGQDG